LLFFPILYNGAILGTFMNVFYGILFFITIAFAQESLQVVRLNSGFITNELEKEIIENVVDLYNRKNSDKFILDFQTVHSVPHLFSSMDRANKEENICFLSAITITNERQQKYDFSVPYLDIEECLFRLDKHVLKEGWQNRFLKVAYVIGTTEEALVDSLQKVYKIVSVPTSDFKEKVALLQAGKVDLMVGDNILGWYSDTFKIVQSLSTHKKTQYGIAYPKGSPLKNNFDKYIRYFTQSEKFLTLLKHMYSKDVADYFRKQPYYVSNQ